jgi:hypothetical protein
VKVVEGSDIYNFPIHHLVHFSCKISSFYHSNSASPKEIKQAATPPAPACAVRRLGIWAARAFPRPCRPEAGGHSEALRSPPTPRGARPLAGQPHSAVPCGPRGAPCTSATADAARRTASKGGCPSPCRHFVTPPR